MDARVSDFAVEASAVNHKCGRSPKMGRESVRYSKTAPIYCNFFVTAFFSIKKNQYSVILVQCLISHQIISLKQFAIYDVT